MRRSRFMDRIANCWLWLSRKINRRPLAVLGLLVGALIWIGLHLVVIMRAGHAGRPSHVTASDAPTSAAMSTSPDCS